MKKDYKGLNAEKISFSELMHSEYTGVQSGCWSILAFTTSVLEQLKAQCIEAMEETGWDESWGEYYVVQMEREDWGL